MKEKGIARQIFKEIDSAIVRTISNTPTLIRDSKFMEELKEIKRRWCEDKKPTPKKNKENSTKNEK